MLHLAPLQGEDSTPQTPRSSTSDIGELDTIPSVTGGPYPPPPPPSLNTSSIGSGSISPRSGISSEGLSRAAQGLRQATPVEK